MFTVSVYIKASKINFAVRACDWCFSLRFVVKFILRFNVKN
jgi:hypothetical protein